VLVLAHVALDGKGLGVRHCVECLRLDVAGSCEMARGG
jgi:hypothetical protein